MSGIQTKDIVKYAVLPGIFPRVGALFSSGFSYVAFLMAQIYGMVRLLPAGHPYLNPKNTGRYGIRHVIAESANSIVISKKNIDQLVIFVLMLTAITLLALQLGTLVLSLIFGPAIAGSIFVTTNPDGDIAFMLLDQVFGVGDGTVANNFFNSCVANTGIACPDQPASIPFPWPFHIALRNLFRFYSLAILIIGTLIFLYFVLVVVVETAATGAPFGQRFQNVWVPIRLVVAIGLLIPLQFGYNSGQYVTFFAAKYGSGLATQTWNRYNAAIAGRLGAKANPLGEAENLIAAPAYPDAAPIVMALSMIHACAFSTYFADAQIVKSNPGGVAVGGTTGTDNKFYFLPPPEDSGAYASYISSTVNPRGVRPYLVKSPQSWQTTTSPQSFVEVVGGGAGAGTTYENALQFYTGGDIVIRFGRKGDLDWDKDGTNETLFNEEPGSVEPTCGEIRIPITDRRPTDSGNVHTTDGFLGTVAMQRFYYNLIRDHWFNFANAENFVDFGGRFTFLNAGDFTQEANYNECSMGCNPDNTLLVEGASQCTTAWPTTGTDDRPCAKEQPSIRWRQEAVNTMQATIDTQMNAVWVQYNTDTNEFDMDPAILDRGWGGAGIWFNRLAQVNGAFVEAQLNFPSYDLIPKVMKQVSEQKKQKDNDSEKCEAYNPNASSQGGQIVFPVTTDKSVALVAYKLGCYWTAKSSVNEGKPGKTLDSNIMKQGINLIFGTYGLFAMTERNANIHPLAQLVTMGKGLVEATVRNIAGSTMFAVGGGLATALGAQGGGGLGDTASSFLSSTAFIGLTAGVVLFYILPFLPFVYFYFAVASWVKTIFEAMVGVPLWALAHLRLDGDGLPGESAANGYFLIFEIFVRPVLSIAGLVAAMIIFTAQVRVLNFIWLLVTENVGGHNGDPSIGFAEIQFKRGVIDEFFYTVVYAIICYILATTAFKLIDKIPDNILRWMGQGVSSFGDINSDPTESLTKYAALGGLTAGQQIVGGINTAGKGLGQAIAAGRAGGGGSDRHIKEDIEYLGLENGIPIYAFNYIGEPERYKGVMAQDILTIQPEAVYMLNGYLAVDYDMIGIKMERLDTIAAGGKKA